MARQEFRDQARVEVVAAARPIADQHADGLAAVEVGDRIGHRSAGARREQGESGQSAAIRFIARGDDGSYLACIESG